MSGVEHQRMNQKGCDFLGCPKHVERTLGEKRGPTLSIWVHFSFRKRLLARKPLETPQPPPHLVALRLKLSPGFSSSSAYFLLSSTGGEGAKILDNL